MDLYVLTARSMGEHFGKKPVEVCITRILNLSESAVLNRPRNSPPENDVQKNTAVAWGEM